MDQRDLSIVGFENRDYVPAEGVSIPDTEHFRSELGVKVQEGQNPLQLTG